MHCQEDQDNGALIYVEFPEKSGWFGHGCLRIGLLVHRMEQLERLFHQLPLGRKWCTAAAVCMPNGEAQVRASCSGDGALQPMDMVMASTAPWRLKHASPFLEQVFVDHEMISYWLRPGCLAGGLRLQPGRGRRATVWMPAGLLFFSFFRMAV